MVMCVMVAMCVVMMCGDGGDVCGDGDGVW